MPVTANQHTERKLNASALTEQDLQAAREERSGAPGRCASRGGQGGPRCPAACQRRAQGRTRAGRGTHKGGQAPPHTISARETVKSGRLSSDRQGRGRAAAARSFGPLTERPRRARLRAETGKKKKKKYSSRCQRLPPSNGCGGARAALTLSKMLLMAATKRALLRRRDSSRAMAHGLRSSAALGEWRRPLRTRTHACMHARARSRARLHTPTPARLPRPSDASTAPHANSNCAPTLPHGLCPTSDWVLHRRRSPSEYAARSAPYSDWLLELPSAHPLLTASSPQGPAIGYGARSESGGWTRREVSVPPSNSVPP